MILRVFHRPLLRRLAVALFAQFATISVTAAQPSQGAETARVEISGREILLTGNIDSAALQQVRALLASDNARQIETLAIDSTSGDSEAAMRLGSLLRERRLRVRVQRVCAGVCAYYVAVAARHLVVPDGAFFLLTQMPSPQLSATILARSRDNALPENERQRMTQMSSTVIQLLASQDSYYRALGADPARIYVAMDVLEHISRQLRAAGKPTNPLGFVPDAAFLRQCFGIAQVDMPTFTADDSRRLAHAGRVPLAFLISDVPYYEGERLSPLSFSCAPRP